MNTNASGVGRTGEGMTRPRRIGASMLMGAALVVAGV